MSYNKEEILNDVLDLATDYVLVVAGDSLIRAAYRNEYQNTPQAVRDSQVLKRRYIAEAVCKKLFVDVSGGKIWLNSNRLHFIDLEHFFEFWSTPFNCVRVDELLQKFYQD
jgi:hypothetical protein